MIRQRGTALEVKKKEEELYTLTREVGNSKQPLSGSKYVKGQSPESTEDWMSRNRKKMCGVTTFIISRLQYKSLSVVIYTLNLPSSPKSIYARAAIVSQLILTCMGLGTIKKVLAGGGAGHCTLPSVMSLDLLRRDHHKNL